jgi:flagellar biosynthetic protein FliP
MRKMKSSLLWFSEERRHLSFTFLPVTAKAVFSVSSIVLFLVSLHFIVGAKSVLAASNPFTLPNMSLEVGGGDPEGLSVAIQIIMFLALLTFIPAILIMMTSFTRLIIVFSLLKQAMGTQQVPPNQILIGLALFLTLFIMSPVLQDIKTNALDPYLDNSISQEEALNTGLKPLRDFMLRQTREKDLALFVELSGEERPEGPSDLSTKVLIPAFITSELKTAFQIGFLIYIPFLVIDMVVASVLMSMGMMMLPPVMISLPFKLMLFVLVDGWYLMVGSLVNSVA